MSKPKTFEEAVKNLKLEWRLFCWEVEQAVEPYLRRFCSWLEKRLRQWG